MQDYLNFAKELAVEVGDIIRDGFDSDIVFETKSDNSILTDIDLQINKLVIERINLKFPEHDILGEEESDRSNDSKYVWVCDPVDGTLPFTQGIPSAVFSLALTIDGESVVGVVYEPVLNKLYYASKGDGAYLNEKSIHVSKQDKLELSTVEFCWRKNFPKFDPSEKIKELYLAGPVVTNHHAIVYAGSLIAAGKLEGLVFPKTTAHDAAAIKVIIEEAGGKFTDICGNDQRYDQDTNGFIASNGLIHDELVELFEDIKIK